MGGSLCLVGQGLFGYVISTGFFSVESGLRGWVFCAVSLRGVCIARRGLYRY